MRRQSIRFRISVPYTIVLGIILLAYSATLYFTLSHVVYGKIDEELQEKVRAIHAAVASYANILEPDHEVTPKSLSRAISLINSDQTKLLESGRLKNLDKEWRVKLLGLGLNHDYVVVFYPNGDLAEKTGNIENRMMPILKKSVFDAPLHQPSIATVMSDDIQLKVIVHPSYRDGKLRNILLVATSVESAASILRKRFIFIVTSIPLVLLIAGFLARYFVARSLRPIRAITNTMNEITYKDLNKQVETSLSDREIVDLKDALNKMVVRLQQAFQNIDEFSSNVAHELKTPLAIIRGEAEVTLLKERDAEEYKRVITVVLEEGQRMLKMIDDLLLLNKLDYQHGVFQFEPIETSIFFTEIYEQTKKIAALKNIKVEFNLPPTSKFIEGNRLHLRRLFFNLIDNAIKFTAPDGAIGIKIMYADARTVVEISDTGVGIAEKDLNRIYDRFFHFDRTNWGNIPGSGLGLSIVKSIAQLHKGTLDVRSVLGKGTTFIVTIPLV